MFGSVGGYLPGSGLRPASTTGRIQGGLAGGMRYPHPFFDIAHTYLPVTIKQLFRWCRHFFLLEPVLHIGILKLSEYAITDVIIDNESEAVAKKWSEFLQDSLRIRSFQIEVGIDFYVYGNAFITISYPFTKYLTCNKCKFHAPAEKIREYYRFINYDFRLSCPSCGHEGNATPQDHYIRNADGIRLLRLNPEDLEIDVNEVTGATTYFYQVPGSIRSDVMMGKKHVIENTPQLYIQAMRTQMSVILDPKHVFHMRRPTLASQDRGWGIPLMLPLLKDTFQLQIMKKASESILLEHLVPLRVLFPQMGSGSSDPYTSINLQEWKAHVAAEIARWRMDCVAPDTWIETQEGVLKAKEVQEGTLLKNHLGGFSKVEKVWRRPLREGERAYQLEVCGLRGIPPIVSEGHPFLIQRLSSNEEKLTEGTFVRTKDIQVGDYVGYPLAASKGLEPFVPNTGILTDTHIWHRIDQITEVETTEVIGFQLDKATSVMLADDSESHGTFCLWGLASANSNYIPILPLPVGNQTLGGDGKALLMTSEIREKHEHLLACAGIPREFVFGGISYSGANVSLRIQENSSLGYLSDHHSLLRWLIKDVSSFLRWPRVESRFKPFKMADDIQRQALNLQLNAAGKLSDTTLLAGLDYSQKDENEIMVKETSARMEATKTQQLAMARLQGEQQLIMTQYQARAAQVQAQAQSQTPAQGEPGGPETMGVGTAGGQVAGDIPAQNAPQSAAAAQEPQPPPNPAAPTDQASQAYAQAQSIAAMPPDQQQMALQNLAAQNPELAQKVEGMLRMMGVNAQAAQGNPVDMRPMPEKLPPRRENPTM